MSSRSCTHRELAIHLLHGFALRTGLMDPSNPHRPAKVQTRYLWTDAKAICALVSLKEYELANRLVDQVNWVLGRTADGKRWISGLPEKEGMHSPTIGGLRAGRPVPQRDVKMRDPDEHELQRQVDTVLRCFCCISFREKERERERQRD